MSFRVIILKGTPVLDITKVSPGKNSVQVKIMMGEETENYLRSLQAMLCPPKQDCLPGCRGIRTDNNQVQMVMPHHPFLPADTGIIRPVWCMHSKMEKPVSWVSGNISRIITISFSIALLMLSLVCR